MRWLRWASVQRMNGNRAGDAALLIDALRKQVWALEGKVQAQNTKLQQYRDQILNLRSITRDVWADLDQCAKRSGIPNWSASELRNVTVERIIELHGRLGRGRND